MSEQMTAMQVVELGRPMVAQKIDRPEPAAGEVLVQIHACGVNFGDLLIVDGKYQEKRPLPFTPGMEVAATVRAVGEGVTMLKVGQRVGAYCGFGGFAEYAAIPADICVPVPDAMSDTDVAAFLIAYGTSDVALRYRARLQPGETLLVLGASGGVSSVVIPRPLLSCVS